MWSNPEFLAGVDHYVARRYWEAHEAWEPLWRNADAPDVRRLMQGLIQVAAGMHKAHTQGDPAAAARILTRALGKLDPLPSALHGIDVACVRNDVRGNLLQLASVGIGPGERTDAGRLIAPSITRG